MVPVSKRLDSRITTAPLFSSLGYLGPIFTVFHIAAFFTFSISDIHAGADDRGIGMIGGVGLVTKEVRREKEIPKILERHPVDTNRNKGLNRQPEPTFQSFTGKLTHEKKSVPERPLPESN